jgi:hypothetical protein
MIKTSSSVAAGTPDHPRAGEIFSATPNPAQRGGIVPPEVKDVLCSRIESGTALIAG